MSELWVAWNDEMAEGYYDIVGPFTGSEEAIQFAESRGDGWTAGALTNPMRWKPLLYPWEVKK
jgi:hypothetical protein